MKYNLLLILLFFVIDIGNTQTTKWKVIWSPNPEPDIKEYIVFRDYIEIGRVKSPDTLFVDDTIKPGILYSYRIKAVNEKNLAGAYSDPTTAAVPTFRELPKTLGISNGKPIELILKNYIEDPDDIHHEISRINTDLNSKVNLNLKSGKLIFTVNNYWQQYDVDTVEIKISDSDGFYNTAKIVIKDIELLNKIEQTIQDYKKITLYPEEFSLSQFRYVTITHVPVGSNIAIYNSFGELVYSKKNADDTFEWDAENNMGDRVLFGLYNFVISDISGNIIFEKSFRVIP